MPNRERLLEPEDQAPEPRFHRFESQAHSSHQRDSSPPKRAMKSTRPQPASAGAPPRAQHRIAIFVTEAVVDRLEVVEIHEQDRDGLAARRASARRWH